MAKGVTFLKAARQIVIGTNVCFFILGVVMLSIALVGYFKNDEMKQNTDVMEQLNLGMLTIIIIVAAGATVFTSFLGFMGAYYKSMLTLKLYVVLVLITFLTQVAIGAYLLNLNMSSLRTSWEQDDQEGAARRNQLQQYMECCGFDTWSDSIGTLHTDCPYLPTYPLYTEPTACFQAAKDFVSGWLGPVAIAAIVIGSIEGMAMVVTFALIMKSKETDDDTAFDY
jgi:Ca2+/Na+ antiporter